VTKWQAEPWHEQAHRSRSKGDGERVFAAAPCCCMREVHMTVAALRKGGREEGREGGREGGRKGGERQESTPSKYVYTSSSERERRIGGREGEREGGRWSKYSVGREIDLYLSLYVCYLLYADRTTWRGCLSVLCLCLGFVSLVSVRGLFGCVLLPAGGMDGTYTAQAQQRQARNLTFLNVIGLGESASKQGDAASVFESIYLLLLLRRQSVCYVCDPTPCAGPACSPKKFW